MPGAPLGRAGAALSGVYLVVDSRERAVAPFLDTALAGFPHVWKQVGVGDYHVCRYRPGGAPLILMAIERKTLKDFAASFTDNRWANLDKMRALRAATGCQLYFFVEGPAFPAPSRRFGRIPYASILGAMTKLMARDGVFVVQTENEEHTAKRLADFLGVFAALPPPAALPPVAGTAEVAEAEVAEGAEGAGASAEVAEAGAEAVAEAAGAPPVPEELLARTEQSLDDAAAQMWAALRGVTVVLGKMLAREFSVADLVGGLVPPAQIQALKTATGRKLNSDARAGLLALCEDSAEHAGRIVAGLRGVSPAIAAVLLAAAGGLRGLCRMSEASLAAVLIPQKNRASRFGQARAARVLCVLHYCDRAAAAWRSAAPAAGRPPPAALAAPLSTPAAALPDSDVLALLAGELG